MLTDIEKSSPAESPHSNDQLVDNSFENTVNGFLIDGTQILTPQGWRDLKDVTKDDFIAQYLRGRVQFVKPLHLTKLQYDGLVYELESPRGEFHQIVTPHHHIALIRDTGQESTASAKDIHRHRLDYARHSVILSALLCDEAKGSGEETQQLSLCERLFLQLHHTGFISSKPEGNATQEVWYNVPDNPVADYVLRLVDELGFVVKEQTNLQTPTHTGSFRQFCLHVPASHTHYLTRDLAWMNLGGKSASWVNAVMVEFQTSFTGEEPEDDTHGVFSSTSRECIELYQACAALHGITTRLAYRPGHQMTGSADKWELYWRVEDTYRVQELSISTQDYTGDVYGLVAPSGAIVVRYNDAVSIAAN